MAAEYRRFASARKRQNRILFRKKRLKNHNLVDQQPKLKRAPSGALLRARNPGDRETGLGQCAAAAHPTRRPCGQTADPRRAKALTVAFRGFLKALPYLDGHRITLNADSADTELGMSAEHHAKQGAVRGPEGMPITLDDLPPPGTKRWVIRRKAEVVAGVRAGLLSLDEACQRYTLSVEEFLSWQRLIDRHGLRGLRVTRLQDYRGNDRTMDEVR